MNADQLGQDFDDASRANRSSYIDRQAFTRVPRVGAEVRQLIR